MSIEVPEETTSLAPIEKATPALSSAAIIAFLLAVFALASTFLLSQWIVWFLEQMAIASSSADFLAASGKIWFVAQTVIILIVVLPFFYFSHNTLRPIYLSWLVAALLTVPAFVLRFIGPNQDQPGALIQIAIGLVGGVAVLLARWRSLDFNLRPALSALAVTPLAIWPFLLWGAPGSPWDIFLNLLAGLSFGLLAASLMTKTTNNILLDGLGAGVLLGILGSSFGYDGGQVLLIVMLPAFGFVLAAFAPSLPAMIVTLGLVTASCLIFIDPTELSIVLQDFFPWGFAMVVQVMVNGWVVGLLLWAIGKWKNRPQISVIPTLIALFMWICALVLFARFGQAGFYGDRLFVILKEQADLTPMAQIADPAQRRAEVFKTLTETANRSQTTMRESFDRFGLHYTPYYLVNAIEVDDSLLVRFYLATQTNVDRVIASPRLRPLHQANEPESSETTSVEENPGWNIKMIGADRVWDEFNVKGKGILVGQSDTGVDGKHPALKNSYRGKIKGDYLNWYDPWNHSTSPTDVNMHGTHTLGTVLGSGGIGVAPEAQWIGCVNLGRNFGNPALYLDCMQFLLAPFVDGGDPFKGSPSQGAQVLNNSWGCPPIEGCDANALKPAADALRAAGVFVVVSTGNDGPSCSTVNSPLALYDSVFSVGAVDRYKHIAFFSSRGPIQVDESGRTKPDIVAPGEDIVSSVPGGGYDSASGTSMAGPHLVGVIALMWSANPALIGDIDRTEQILIQTAKPITEVDECTSTDSLPNNTFGFGLVDAYAAVKMALGK